MAFPRGGSSSTVSRSHWNLEVLVFDERGKPEYPKKNISTLKSQMGVTAGLTTKQNRWLTGYNTTTVYNSLTEMFYQSATEFTSPI